MDGNIRIYCPFVFRVRSGPNQVYSPECDWGNLSPSSTRKVNGDETQVLEESELVDFLANKAPKSHKAMLIYQGFNPETSILTTFVGHCERAETTNAIASAKFVASDEENEPKTKKRSKSKSDRGKKRPKRLPRSIAPIMEKIRATPPRSATLSRPKIRQGLSSPRRTLRKGPRNSISSRKRPPLKRQSTSSTRSSTRQRRGGFWTLKVNLQAARRKIPLVKKKIHFQSPE